MSIEIADSKRTERWFPVGPEEIERAAAILAGQIPAAPGLQRPIAVRTPLTYSETFSRQLGCQVYLKLENLQTTGSYKIRGAFNNIANLSPEQREGGVVTASAGNHAQGVGYSAHAFGIAEKSTVFVPIGTPKVKQENTRGFGVEVVETGDNFDLAREAAYQAAADSGRPFIEPFDDWNTIAGQGTIGLEILADLPGVAGIVAPVGGGGLISGIAIAASNAEVSPRIIGVEAEGCASTIYALEQGAPVPLPYPPQTQIADGIKVRQVGERPFEVIRQLVGLDQLLTVSDTEIVAAIADLMVYSKTMAEGAGAAAMSGLRAIQSGRSPGMAPFGPEDAVAVVVSGGNIDSSFSWRILYEQTVPNLMAIRIAIPDRPGELLRLLMPIAAANVNIIDVDVNRLDARPRMGERIVELCLAITGKAQADLVVATMHERGYQVQISAWQDPALRSRGSHD